MANYELSDCVIGLILDALEDAAKASRERADSLLLDVPDGKPVFVLARLEAQHKREQADDYGEVLQLLLSLKPEYPVKNNDGLERMIWDCVSDKFKNEWAKVPNNIDNKAS